MKRGFLAVLLFHLVGREPHRWNEPDYLRAGYPPYPVTWAYLYGGFGFVEAQIDLPFSSFVAAKVEGGALLSFAVENSVEAHYRFPISLGLGLRL